jgi:hypothetical protein
MASRQLSPDIVSLIHHVELNESGWWKKGVSQIIKALFWTSHIPSLTIQGLHEAIQREAPGMNLSVEELDRQLTTLRDQGTISFLPGQTYKLTEPALKELSAEAAAAQAEQAECQQEFVESCAKHCPGLDQAKVWKDFTEALARAIRVSGANLFNLLVGGQLRKDFDWLDSLITKVEPDHREGLRNVLMSFFDPNNHVCRNQILRFMTAYFFAEATRLHPETLEMINKARKVKAIKVVLDTNFLFSILQLHDNPADAAAVSLVDLASKSEGKLDIRLYVLPSTLEEARRVLMAQLHQVEHIRTTQAMARAAMTQPMPSIAKKFFSTAATTPGLSAQAYFAPYIDDLRLILEGRGIAVLDAHPEIYNKRQDVIDDVMTGVKREEADFPENRRKSYQTLLHDAVLWHAVNDRRPANTDSPFETEYWAVSIDWRLIGFDRAKRTASGSSLPVVLHPSNLVQLIQFWVPRTPELEESLVDALRLPLFFQSFDLEDEKATLKVLESLSRFENIADLPENAIRVVLTNRALRGRLKKIEASNEEAFQLVRDEILTHHREVSERLELANSSLQEQQLHLDQERQAREAALQSQQETARRIADEESRRQEAERNASNLAVANAQLEGRLQQSSQVSNQQIQSERDRADGAERTLARIYFAVVFVIIPALLGGLIFWLSNGITPDSLPGMTTDARILFARLAVAVLPLTVFWCLAPRYADNRSHLKMWWPSRAISWIGRKVILAPSLLAIEAIFAGGTWDGIKLFMNWN